MNGYAKTDAPEGIGRAGRVRGIAAQTLLPAFQLAHANERKINAWFATLPAPTGRPTEELVTENSNLWAPGPRPDPSTHLPLE